MPKNHDKTRFSCSPSTVEILEPRILYSADALVGLLPLVASSEHSLQEAFDSVAALGPVKQAVSHLTVNDTSGSLHQHQLLGVGNLSSDAEIVEPAGAISASNAGYHQHTVVAKQTLVIVDQGAPASDRLINALQDETVTVIRVGEDDSGITRVTQALQQLQQVESIQIYSHGDAGQINLGSTAIDEHVLRAQEAVVSSWANYLTPDADILLLGCNIADDASGRSFVNTLSQLTQADVAASSDLTGHASLGGDWELEYQTGGIESSVVLNDVMQADWEHVLASITVTNTSDGFDIPDGTDLDTLIAMQAAGDNVTLREAVYAAQQGADGADVINLVAGTYELDRTILVGEDQGKFSDLDFYDHTTIIGQGPDQTIIDATVNGIRVIDVHDSTLILEGLKVSGGSALGKGGGIQSAANTTVQLDNVWVTNNTALNEGGGLHVGGQLSATETTIADNEVTFGAGSNAANGGAIYGSDSSTIELEFVEIRANKAEGDGAGIRTNGSLTVVDGFFTQNESDRNGGAFHATGAFTLSESVVTGNIANDNGAGVYGANLTITESTISNNIAGNQGGGIYAQTNLLISNSELNSNESEDRNGGAIYAQADLEVENTIFTNNRSLTAHGGAIHVTNPALIANSTFTGNSANNGEGGAIYIQNLTDTPSNPTEIDGSTFSDNSAGSLGGAILAVEEVGIDDSSFTNNTATTGGALYVLGGVNIFDSGFHQNTATDNGGAIHSRNFVHADRSSFTANTAGNEGGAISQTTLGKLQLTNTTFHTNVADVGGAISSAREPIIVNSTFVANTATSGAAAISIVNRTGVVTNSLFADNLQAGVKTDAFTTNLVSEGFNLFDYDHSATVATDINNVTNPLLGGVLDRVGSPVKAVALQPGSPAINAGKSETDSVDTYNVARDEINDIGAFEADSEASVVVWSDLFGDIYRANNQLNNIQEILTATGADDLALDTVNRRVYWIDDDTGSVEWTSLDGLAGETVLISLVSEDPTSIALDVAAGHLYLAVGSTSSTTVANGRIDRYDLITGDFQQTVVDSNIDFIGDMEVDQDLSRLFWADENIDLNSAVGSIPIVGSVVPGTRGAIGSVALDGTDLVVQPVSNAQSVTSDKTSSSGGVEQLYITETDTNTIYRVRSDGGIEAVYDTFPAELPSYLSFDVSSNQLYFGSAITDQIIGLTSDFSSEAVSYTHTAGLSDLEIASTSTTSRPPVIDTNQTLNVDEGLSSSDVVIFNPIDTTFLNATDEDTAADELVFTVVSEFSNGDLMVDGGSGFTTFTLQDIENDRISYAHNGSETLSDSMRLTLSDGTYTTDEFEFLVTITPVNDSPTLVNFGVLFLTAEGVSYEFVEAMFQTTDDDNSLDDIEYFFTNELLTGQVLVDNQPLQVNERFTHAQVINGDVSYQHTDNADEIMTEQIQFVATDGAANSQPKVLTVNITPSNDAPTLITVADLSINEGSTLLLSPNLVATDPDSDAEDFTYRYSAGLSHGVLELNGSILSVNEKFTQAQLQSNELVYRHDGSESIQENISLIVSDGARDSDVATLAISVEPINDAPTFVALVSALNVNEGGQVTLSAFDFNVLDDDSQPEDLQYVYTAGGSQGSLVVQNKVLALGESFSHSDLANGLVTYQHNGAEPSSETLSFIVNDGLAESAQRTTNVLIQAVNDLPVLQTMQFSVEENQPAAVIGALFATDDDPGDIVSFSITDDRFQLDNNLLSLAPGESLDFEVEAEVSLLVTLRDSVNAERVESVSIQVLDNNDVPIVETSTESFTGNGFALDESLFIDQDGDTLTYEIKQQNGDPLPEWLVFQESTNTFYVKHLTLVEAELPLTITANDGQGGHTSVNLTLLFDPVLAAATENLLPEVIPEIPTSTQPASVPPSSPQSPVQQKVIVSNAIPSQLQESDPEAQQAAKQQAAIDYDIAQFLETINLHELLKTVAFTDGIEYSDTGKSVLATGIAKAITFLKVDDVNQFELSAMMEQTDSVFAAYAEVYARSMDKVQVQQLASSNTTDLVVGSSAGITTSLSMGYLIWLIRGGTLMGSVLSSLPAWRFVDPLPVLRSMTEDLDEDDESLETLVTKGTEKDYSPDDVDEKAVKKAVFKETNRRTG